MNYIGMEPQGLEHIVIQWIVVKYKISVGSQQEPAHFSFRHHDIVYV